jgi:hypothetical protein
VATPFPQPAQYLRVKHIPSFTSGTYTGFFNYAAGGARYPMTLALSFAAGKVSGLGRDEYGAFTIAGTFNARVGECAWTKTYIPERTVEFRGFVDSTSVWGTWEITGVRTGGFQIWRDVQPAKARPSSAGGAWRSFRR